MTDQEAAMKNKARAPDLWGLDMSQLRLLHLLLTETSVSAAALSLGVSQPAVSLRLARLRSLFDDPLLVRAGTALVPTERGRALVEPLEIALDAFERLTSESSFEPAQSRRQLKVAAPNYLGPSLLPQFARAVSLQAPYIRLTLQTTLPGRNYMEDLASGEIDLLVSNWPDAPPHLMTLPLPADRLVCFVCRDHPLAQRSRIDLATWLQQDHISPSSETEGRFSPVDAQMTALGETRRIRTIVTDYSLIPQMLPGTRLVMTTGARFVSLASRSAPVVAVEAPDEFSPVRFRLLWHERSQNDDAHAWLRRVMRNVAHSGLSPDPSA